MVLNRALASELNNIQDALPGFENSKTWESMNNSKYNSVDNMFPRMFPLRDTDCWTKVQLLFLSGTTPLDKSQFVVKILIRRSPPIGVTHVLLWIFILNCITDLFNEWNPYKLLNLPCFFSAQTSIFLKIVAFQIESKFLQQIEIGAVA